MHYCAARRGCDVLPLPGDLLHDTFVRPAGPEPYEQYALETGAGDILVLVSDGLTEAHLNIGDPYGYRFTKVIERHASETARTIAEAIVDDWRAHPRTEDSADDVSVLVIKLTVQP